MKKILRRWVIVALAAILVVWPSLAHACNIDGENCPPPPESDGGGVGYSYDSATRTFYPEASSSETTEVHDGVVWSVRYVVTCGRNHPDRPESDVLCVDALCEVDGSIGYDTLVFRREGVQDGWEPWPGRERICRVSTVGEPIPLADFEAEILAIVEEHYEAISRPEIEVAPAVNAVVNLPVLAATDDPGTVGFDIENPLPGRVDAEPNFGWQWSNGDGGSGPGRGYDGTDPVASPEHYPVRAVFTAPGEGRVSLTATWSIILTVDGIPPISDIEPLVYEEAEVFTVRSARTVLVD